MLTSLTGVTKAQVSAETQDYRASFAHSFGVTEDKIGVRVLDSLRSLRIAAAAAAAAATKTTTTPTTATPPTSVEPVRHNNDAAIAPRQLTAGDVQMDVNVECSSKNVAAQVVAAARDNTAFNSKLLEQLRIRGAGNGLSADKISSTGVVVKDSSGTNVPTSELPLAVPISTTPDAVLGSSNSDKAIALAKKAAGDLAPAEVAGIIIAAIASLVGIYLSVKKFFLEKKKIKKDTELRSIEAEAAKIQYKNRELSFRVHKIELEEATSAQKQHREAVALAKIEEELETTEGAWDDGIPKK